MSTKTAKIPLTHPGESLKEDFMDPKGLTAYRVAKDMGISQTALSEIINGKRGITSEMALRLETYTGASAQFWIGLQMDYDLRKAKNNRAFIAKLKSIPRPTEPAIEIAAA